MILLCLFTTYQKSSTMDHFFKNILHDLKRNSTVLACGHNCIEWNGACTDTGYGRKRVTWPDGQKSIEKTHRLAFMAYNKILPDKLLKTNEFGQQLDVSHLCHNKKCINEDHLVHEPHVTNMDRNGCFASGYCSKRHKPYCLL